MGHKGAGKKLSFSSYSVNVVSPTSAVGKDVIRISVLSLVYRSGRHFFLLFPNIFIILMTRWF
jgi:hypothetical protein